MSSEKKRRQRTRQSLVVSVCILRLVSGRRSVVSDGVNFEYVVPPGRQIDVELCRREIAACALVLSAAHHIVEANRTAGQIRERQPHVTLTLIAGIVHGDEQPL